MVAIASDLSNDFIGIPCLAVRLGLLVAALLSRIWLHPGFVTQRQIFVRGCQPSISLKLNARSIDEPARSLATPLSRSAPVLRFVRSRQGFVRRCHWHGKGPDH